MCLKLEMGTVVSGMKWGGERNIIKLKSLKGNSPVLCSRKPNLMQVWR